MLELFIVKRSHVFVRLVLQYQKPPKLEMGLLDLFGLNEAHRSVNFSLELDPDRALKVITVLTSGAGELAFRSTHPLILNFRMIEKSETPYYLWIRNQKDRSNRNLGDFALRGSEMKELLEKIAQLFDLERELEKAIEIPEM